MSVERVFGKSDVGALFKRSRRDTEGLGPSGHTSPKNTACVNLFFL